MALRWPRENRSARRRGQSRLVQLFHSVLRLMSYRSVRITQSDSKSRTYRWLEYILLRLPESRAVISDRMKQQGMLVVARRRVSDISYK